MDNPELVIAYLKVATVVGSFIVMVLGLILVFDRLKTKEQGFGPNTLRVIGIVIFLPLLLILSVLTEFKTETLAALLGTIAGYVLSESGKWRESTKGQASKKRSNSTGTVV